MATYNGRDVTVLGPTHPDFIELVKIKHNDALGTIEDVRKSLVEWTDEEFDQWHKDKHKKLDEVKKQRAERKADKAKEAAEQKKLDEQKAREDNKNVVAPTPVFNVPAPAGVKVKK